MKEERPLQFFAGWGLLLLLASLALGLPVVSVFLRTGLVPRLPTAVLAMGLTVMAMLAFSVALILDSVTRGRKELKRLAYLAIPRVAPAEAPDSAVAAQPTPR